MGSKAIEDASEDASESLGELVFRALEQRELEGDAALEALFRDHPEHATALRERLALLGDLGLVASAQVRDHPETLGEFRLVRQLGAGGMGVVYLAVQERLGREVALKLVRPEHLYFPGARERLVREVETVARLSHPGIVPVYSVGEEKGLPFFAMQLVRGASLESVLSSLKGRDPSSLTGADLAPPEHELLGEDYLFSGSWEEACLRVIRQVAEALDYAHRRGVLHRDVKPSNIMLATEGSSRAMLVDFGLAATGQGTRLTRTGSQLGSLHYMSPEQARGDMGALDGRTDVYSLGVTLYQLLTLTLPFEGRTDTEVFRAIELGDPPRVRARNPGLSWEAETVCLAAMERDVARRYASAADFARDLGNALEKRPIEARRAGALLRARRWIERHPTKATAVALGFLVAVGAPTLYAWQEHRAALVIADERDRAQRSYGYAMEAIDRMLSKVGDVDLRFVPQMEPVRMSVLEDAVALLERVAAEGGSQGAGRAEVADAHIRLGDLLSELGRSNDALAAFSRGVAVLDELSAEDADDTKRTARWAHASMELARSMTRLGNAAEARPIHAAVQERLERALPRAADGRELQRLLLSNQSALAALQNAVGEFDAARSTYQAAAEGVEKLMSDAPDREELVTLAINIYNGFGLLLLQRFTQEGQKNEEALRVLTRTVELSEQVAAQVPDDPQHRSRVALSMINLGGALRRAKEYEQAREAYEPARDLLVDLVRDFPSTWNYKLELATAHNQLGLLYDYMKDAERAEPEYVATAALLEELVAAAPGELSFSQRLAIVRYNVSALWRAKGELARAEDVLLQAIEDAERARALAPQDSWPREVLSDVYTGLAIVRRDRGDHSGAADAAELAPKSKPDDPASYKRAAFGLAQCVEMVQALEELPAEERERLALDYAERACAQIRGLMDRTKLPKKLGDMLDYKPLHGLEPFERLLAEREPEER